MQSKLLPIVILVLLFFTCTWIVFYLQPGPRGHLGIGFLLGALYGHSTLASGWIVFGPGGWTRVPLAFVWLLSIPWAVAINTIIYSNTPDAWFIWLSAGAIMAMVQMLSWPLRLAFRLRICRTAREGEAYAGTLCSRQFGIRELMILTTVVALFIGGGRLTLPLLLKWHWPSELAILAFFVVVSVVICVPTIFSILAMQRPVVPTLILFVFVAIATYWELPLISSLGLSGGGPDRLHLILINVFSILPIVVVCVMLRIAGYQLSTFSSNVGWDHLSGPVQ